MTFVIHPNSRLGYKILSDADLGRGTSTHQTHIGMFGDTLECFIDQPHNNLRSIVISKYGASNLPCPFDYIRNPDGSYRSPKVRSGDQHDLSAVREIRRVAFLEPSSRHWKLFWFVLTDQTIVFCVTESSSEVVTRIKEIAPEIGERGSISPDSPRMRELLDYFESIQQGWDTDSPSRLESNIYEDDLSGLEGIDPVLLAEAQQSWLETGRLGEECIFGFLTSRVEEGEIRNLVWNNAERESFLPYDFSFSTLDGETVFVDAKSTSGGFGRPIYLSLGEIRFIVEHPNYHIYRVYELSESQFILRTCSELQETATLALSETEKLGEALFGSSISLAQMKLAVDPLHPSTDWGAPLVIVRSSHQ